MIKIINSVPYSTDSSCRLGYFQHRTILDPAYHREELYITRQGTYFLYVEGRESNPYCFQGDPFPAAGCDITVLSDIEVHIAKLNGRLCGAKRPHSVSEQPNFYQSLQSNPYNDSSHPSGGE